jgi:hypothetical protein
MDKRTDSLDLEASDRIDDALDMLAFVADAANAELTDHGRVGASIIIDFASDVIARAAGLSRRPQGVFTIAE